MKFIDERYKAAAKQQGLEWADFLEQYFSYDEEQYNEELKLFAEEIVKTEMTVYAAAEKEGVKVSKKDYQEQLDSIREAYGYTDDESFEEAAGMSVEEFAEQQHSLKLNLFLEEVLDSIYDRLSKNQK